MIQDFKDLEKLLKLCRKQGVTDIKLGDIELKFGELPIDLSKNIDINSDPYVGFPGGELTPEQLMFYSAGGLPSDDPALKGGSN